MDMGFPSEVMKMFWNSVVVTVAQQCEYVHGRLKRKEFNVSFFHLSQFLLLF